MQSHRPTFDYLIPTVLTVELPRAGRQAEINYPPHQMWTARVRAEEQLDVYEGRVRIFATVRSRPTGRGRHRDRATLRYQACDDNQCLPPLERERRARARRSATGGEPRQRRAVRGPRRRRQRHAPAADARGDERAPPTRPPAAVTGAAPHRPGRARPARDLLGKLLLGVLGGLILNAMPCVLPVLSLKLFGLLQPRARGAAPW